MSDTGAGSDGASGRPAAVGWAEEAVAVGMAAACWLGAWAAPPGLRPVVAAVVGLAAVAAGLALLVTSPRLGRVGPSLAVALVMVGVLLVAGHRGAGADRAHQPLPAGPLSGPAVVVGDPEPSGPAGWTVELRLPSGARIEATAFGRAGTVVSRTPVGATLTVEGRLRPVGERPWLRTRHIVALASLSTAEPMRGPGPLWAVTEVVRERIGAGADRFDDRSRALYRGLVLGDDRFQAPGQVLRFRLSGLSHLLAVSGQNVAFVLATARPLLHRLDGRRRLVVVAVLLLGFALVTRLEPSVLRAVTAAAIATWAAAGGRARSGLGVLAAAVVVLVLADPFLVDSVGFQLSVGASLGILGLGPIVDRRLPGPRWLAQPLATSLAAQAGVAPVLQHHFGPMSLVAIPANLLAGWAAAFIMTWGLSVGVVAGLSPGGVASVLQWPVGVALWWLDRVAAVGARLPGPRPGLLVVVGLVVLVLLARAVPEGVLRVTVIAIAVVALVASIPRPSPVAGPCGTGIGWYPAGPSSPSVLVVGERAGLGAVEACRLAGIRSVDLVVVERGARSEARVIAALREVVLAGTVLAPPRHVVLDARRLLDPMAVEVAGGRLELRPDPSGQRIAIVPTG